MKKPLLILTTISLSLSAILTPASASASLPSSVEGQAIPSLAPMLEQVTPAVVSVLVEGKKMLAVNPFRNNSASSLALTLLFNRCQKDHSEA